MDYGMVHFVNKDRISEIQLLIHYMSVMPYVPSIAQKVSIVCSVEILKWIMCDFLHLTLIMCFFYFNVNHLCFFLI